MAEASGTVIQGWIRTTVIVAAAFVAVITWVYSLNAAQNHQIEANSKVIGEHQVQLRYIEKAVDEIKVDVKDTRKAVEDLEKNGTLGQILQFIRDHAKEE